MNAAHQAYYKLLEDWQQAVAQKKAAEKLEAHLRAQIVRSTFGENPKEGTSTHELPDHRKVKVKQSMYRRVDKDMLDAGLASQMMEQFNIDVYDRLVRLKPDLSVSEYKKHLKPEPLALFNQCVTTKPGTPTIEIV